MKKIKETTFLNILLLLFIFGCSTKKDTIVNSSINTLGTKYNVLFNGKVAYNEALKDLESKYKDNFYKRLEIEPFTVKRRVNLKTTTKKESSASGFDLAEEKAVKAIQRHSMNFNGDEKNSQIDDAYLLLGKTRYYTQRFTPALEAFNYNLKNYIYKGLIPTTVIWKAKTLLRLGNEYGAKYELNTLLKYKLSNKEFANAYTVMAMINDAYDSKKLVLQNLKKSVKFAKDAKLKARNLFIIGQLYNEFKQVDSSNLAFKKLIRLRKSPYKYRIHAKIELAKNAEDSTAVNAQIKILNKSVKNMDNIPYLDEIYYQLGILSIKKNDPKSAIDYFKKSIKKGNDNNFQKSLGYERLGNYYFDNNEFLKSGAYYDSVFQVTKDFKQLRIRRLKRKSKNLNKLINLENIAKADDSILHITTLSKKEKLEYYKNYITTLKQKKKEEKAKKQKKIIEKNINIANSSTSSNITKGKFYFYNIKTSELGFKEFKKVWGNITLVDNWNRKNNNLAITSTKNEEPLPPIITDTILLYNPKFYLDKLPTSSRQIDSITSQRNNTYYELGLTYKEQFKAYKIAAKKLEKLLTYNPSKSLILPIKYQLFKIYTVLKSPKLEKTKSFILTNYPNSSYASIIKNPKELVGKSFTNKTPKQVYREAYNNYLNKNYISSEDTIHNALIQFKELPIIPKFKLLEAYIHLKLDGINSFSESLDKIIIHYPNTIEGKSAKAVKAKISNKLKNNDKFIKDSINTKLYIGLEIPLKLNFAELKDKLSNFFDKEEITNAKIVKDMYTRESNILLIKNLNSKAEIIYIIDKLKNTDNKFIPTNFFIISQKNYNLVQINKNLAKYISTFYN